MRPLIITRPQPEADQWTAALQALGCPAQALPLLQIGPCTAPAAQQAVERALSRLADYQALMLVSGNAVRYLWPRLAGLALPSGLRCWAPGPGTRQALLDCGVDGAVIDSPAAESSQFDSEALWQIVAPQLRPGLPVLIVRGSDSAEERPAPAQGSGRQWLAQQLQARGIGVDFAPVYCRSAPPPNPQLLTRLQQLHQQQAIWLFSSSECLANLALLAPSLDWSRSTAITTHPRIAAQAQRLGFGRIVPSKPTQQDIRASIESLA